MSFSDLSFKKFCSLLIVSATPLGDQRPGVVIGKLLFLIVILKSEFVASNEVTASNHLPSSIKFIGGEDETVFICLPILKIPALPEDEFLSVQSTYQYVF